MNKPVPILALMLFMTLAHNSAQAESVRCGNRVIKNGDTINELFSACGEPVTRTSQLVLRPVLRRQGFISREPRSRHPGPPYRNAYNRNGHFYQEEVIQEVWTYNFGPRTLMSEVTLIDGIVESVRTLGHGH